MPQSQAPHSVHLVGSIGLDTVEDVFNSVGTTLGPYLRRIPDGEIGGRRIWISWQYPLLRANPHLAPDPSGAVRPTNKFQLLTLAPGAKPEDVHFGELNYAREARASYLDFVEARNKDVIPQGLRFHICLPTKISRTAFHSRNLSKSFLKFPKSFIFVMRQSRQACRANSFRQCPLMT